MTDPLICWNWTDFIFFTWEKKQEIEKSWHQVSKQCSVVGVNYFWVIWLLAGCCRYHSTTVAGCSGWVAGCHCALLVGCRLARGERSQVCHTLPPPPASPSSPWWWWLMWCIDGNTDVIMMCDVGDSFDFDDDEDWRWFGLNFIFWHSAVPSVCNVCNVLMFWWPITKCFDGPLDKNEWECDAVGWNHFSRIGHNALQWHLTPLLTCLVRAICFPRAPVWIGQGSLRVMDSKLSDTLLSLYTILAMPRFRKRLFLHSLPNWKVDSKKSVRCPS